MVVRKQQLQPTVERNTVTCRQTHPIGGRLHYNRPVLARHAMIPTAVPLGHRHRALPPFTQLVLSRAARLSRGGRTTNVDHHSLSAAAPAWLHTRRGAIGRSLRSKARTIATSHALPPTLARARLGR
jgi:hypothetical protein